jgi:hypothetical protein
MKEYYLKELEVRRTFRTYGAIAREGDLGSLSRTGRAPAHRSVIGTT